MVLNRLDVREQILLCEACELASSCSAPVPFHGSTPAELAVLGEAPGKQEDIAGQPFIGPAGQLLRDALTDVGFDPDKLFYLNTVCCYPDGTPTSAHVNACANNLRSQLELAKPIWVLALGNVALSTLRTDVKVTRARGHVLTPNGYGTAPHWYITFHPAAALRNGNTDQALRRDLAAFASIVRAVSHVSPTGDLERGWLPFVDDSCMGCGASVEDMEDHDLGLVFDGMSGAWCAECYRSKSTEGKAEIKGERKVDMVQRKSGRLFL